MAVRFQGTGPFGEHVRRFRRPGAGERGPPIRLAATSRDSAQTAAPRTSGEASASSARQAGTSAASAELPAAISTLRRKRSRPMRLTGEPEKKAPEGCIVERQQVGQRRLAQVLARRQLGLGGRGWRTCSMGRRPGSRRSHRCGCRWPAGIRPGSGPCARWSGRRCSAAHRAGRARERRRSGRRRGRRGRSRNGRPRPRRRESRRW